MKARCAVCAGATRLVFEQGGFPVCACGECGHRQCELELDQGHLASQYGDDYFNGGGAGYQDYLSEADLLIEHGRRYADIVGRPCEPGTLLDIGCAAGFIASAFAEAGWRVTGIEPNAAMAQQARARGLAAHVGGIETLDEITDFSPPAGGFDMVLMVQVAAHFFDLEKAMTTLANNVRPGGHCLVETWDSSSLTARMLGRRWHEYSPPSVLHYFSRKSMDRLMARHGFEVVDAGRPSKRLRLDHAVSLLRYKYGNSLLGSVACGLMSKLPGGLSLPYPSEDLFWALYRRSGAAHQDAIDRDAA